MEDKTTAVLLVAGNSTRYGKGKNKNLEEIHGKSILSYSLDVFSACPEISDVIMVIRPEDQENISSILRKDYSIKPIKLVYGGNTRMESVYHALEECHSNFVLIHDGARPYIQNRYVEECVQAMGEYHGAVVGVPSKDTIKIVNEAGEIVSSTDRSFTWCSQTPQCFHLDTLLKAHEKYRGDSSVTDDAMLLEREGYKVKMIRGDYQNIKVTTPEDYHTICQYL